MNIIKKIINYITTGGHPYKKSRRRDLYVAIAEEFNTTPDKVYEIAHNVRKATDKDEKLIKVLIKRGFIVKKKKKPIKIDDFK